MAKEDLRRAVHRRFGAWLEWAKKESGDKLSQEAVGELLGITQSGVSQIADGTTSIPTARVLGKIENASKSWPDGPILIAEWLHSEPQDDVHDSAPTDSEPSAEAS